MDIVPNAEVHPAPPLQAEEAAPPPVHPIDEAIARLRNRTPQEITAARERAYAASTPPRPLPPGKTLEEVVAGQWPGDETDEEIRELLERIS